MLELADLSRTVMGLGVVLLLMGVVFWLLRRFGQAATAIRPGGGRRLSLVESLAVDPRTRLVLVRQDAREHLIVISSAGSASLVQTTHLSGSGAPAGEVA